MLNSDSLERELRIDEHALDREWLSQPRLCLRYGMMLANARRKLEEARNELEVVRADLDKSIRSSPDDYGIAKVTETAIQSAIQSSSAFREAQQRLIDAKYYVDLLGAVMQSIEQKRSALENLVKLFLAGYYGQPKLGDDSDDFDELVKRRLRRRRMSDEAQGS